MVQSGGEKPVRVTITGVNFLHPWTQNAAAATTGTAKQANDYADESTTADSSGIVNSSAVAVAPVRVKLGDTWLQVSEITIAQVSILLL